jgi:hypothetical protein
LSCRYDRPYMPPGATQGILLLLRFLLGTCCTVDTEPNLAPCLLQPSVFSTLPLAQWRPLQAAVAAQCVQLLPTLALLAASAMQSAMTAAGRCEADTGVRMLTVCLMIGPELCVLCCTCRKTSW